MKKITLCFFLLIIGFKSQGQSYIINYEYWCDTAYSQRYGVSIAPQHQFTIDTLVGFPGLDKGLHTFNIRFQQTNYFWSIPLTQYFYKTGEGSAALGNITAYRYWVQDSDSVVTFHLATPVNPFDLIVDLDLSWVHRGPNYFYIQFCDEQNNWRVAAIDSFYKSAIPAANFYSTDTLLCGNDSVHFYNLSNDADSVQWFFGDGDSSTDVNPVHYYQQPGQYTVTLMAKDTMGVDSTITFTDYISIFPPAQASFSFTQVGINVTFTNHSQNAISYLWDFGDSTTSLLTDPVHAFPHDGNYTVILTAFDSCGSVTDTQYVSILLGVSSLTNDNALIVSHEKNKIVLNFSSAHESVHYSLQNTAGQILYHGEIKNNIPGYKEFIPVDNFAAGIYYLNISDGLCRLSRLITIAY